MNIKANNPELKSWVDFSIESDFSIQNLPFGIFSDKNKQKRVGVAIGDSILDLALTQKLGYLTDLPFLPSDFENEFSKFYDKLWKGGYKSFKK